MALTGRTKSILLQVAMKLAVPSLDARGMYQTDFVEKTTADFYAILVGLHDKLGIDPDEGAEKKGNRGGYAKSEPKPSAGTAFELDGTTILDFREAKLAGKVKDAHPDFKSVGNTPLPGGSVDKDGNVTGSVWLIDRDGNANEDAAPLVMAADIAS